jgi:hypothetical protein
MTIWDLRKIVNELPPEMDDAEVVLQTEDRYSPNAKKKVGGIYKRNDEKEKSVTIYSEDS